MGGRVPVNRLRIFDQLQSERFPLITMDGFSKTIEIL